MPRKKPDWKPTALELLFEQAVLLGPEDRYKTNINNALDSTDINNRSTLFSELANFGLLQRSGAVSRVSNQNGNGGQPPQLLVIPPEAAQYALELIEARIDRLAGVRDRLAQVVIADQSTTSGSEEIN